MKKILFIIPTMVFCLVLVPTPALAIVGNNQQTATQNQGEDEQMRIRLNERFIHQNSATTRIDQMNDEQLKNVKGFTLEVTNRHKVQFKEAIDLSSDDAKTKINQLDDYSDFSQIGKIMIDTDNLDMLKMPATVTLYNIPYRQMPYLYKDGELVTKDDVQNIMYVYSETQKGTMTFDVTSFSTYEVKPVETEVVEYQNNYEMAKMLLLIFFITLIGIIAVIASRLIEDKLIKNIQD